MANEYELSIDIDAPADTAWGIVGDLNGVPNWFTKYVESTLEGDVRTLRNADGGELVERILEHDDAERTYSYTVIGGPPLASHWASFSVVPRDGGCTVLWHTNATFLDATIDTEERLGAAQREGLERIKALSESGA